MLSRNGAHRVSSFLMALLFIALLTQGTKAQLDQHGRWANGISEPWWFPDQTLQEEIVALQLRWKLIDDEKDVNGMNEWAGDYFMGGETHGAYLRWSPKNGFVVLHVDKCAARVEDFSYGRVSVSPTLILLIPERALRSNASQTHGHQPQITNFVPVKFRADRLLIPENEMSDFGDYVAGLGKFNESPIIYYALESPFFYQMKNEGNQDVSDVPIVPSGYERFLKPPIKGMIIAVGKRLVRRDYSYESPSGEGATYVHASITFVTVNLGKVGGATVGLRLNVVGSDEDVKLVRIGKNTSVGIIIRSLDENGKETYFDEAQQERLYPRVSSGWDLTTSVFQ